ncbi:hypothetical protein HPB48_000885 [Haemaphysalis longicornis]|uniref:BPM/SPOP BACK domain-containing protein n=1 Tax=Haemaphysalis longicornis TaxID=44386 RepID=A0A9J6GKI2_HAELO|nr:hypothetical protein HPB48_000885 [Haemaphysalis longicornis]
MCEAALCSELSIETAAETFALADVYNCDKLKVHSIDFINTHSESVMETAGWKVIAEQQPHLIKQSFGTCPPPQSGHGESPMEET